MYSKVKNTQQSISELKMQMYNINTSTRSEFIARFIPERKIEYYMTLNPISTWKLKSEPNPT